MELITLAKSVSCRLWRKEGRASLSIWYSTFTCNLSYNIWYKIRVPNSCYILENVHICNFPQDTRYALNGLLESVFVLLCIDVMSAFVRMHGAVVSLSDLLSVDAWVCTASKGSHCFLEQETYLPSLASYLIGSRNRFECDYRIELT